MRLVLIPAILLIATLGVFAQNDYRENEKKIDLLLLKKDLREAIVEAERLPMDAASLFYRLSLYNRAAAQPAAARILKQIINLPDREKYLAAIREIAPALILKNDLVDAETMRMYLQEINFNLDIYNKFSNLCAQTASICDARGFDEWLKQKAVETRADNFGFLSSNWIALRLDWRGKLRLDKEEVYSELLSAFRKNPADEKAAADYLNNWRSVSEITEIAEKFASIQAYEYYTLGEILAAIVARRDSKFTAQDRRAVAESAVLLFRKSLAVSYNAKDTELIKNRLRFATQMMPRIDDYEKQLRFWTKLALARVYKESGDTQNAQKIVEELARFDKTGILEDDVSSLSGAVQAASGARVVENKILNEEAARENSAAYWLERVGYYHGRGETQNIFDSYLKAFDRVRFDARNEKSKRERLFLFHNFAYFIEDEYGDYKTRGREMSRFETSKFTAYQQAVEVLRKEFRETAADLDYSYRLAQTARAFKFEKPLNEFLRGGRLEKFYAQLPAAQLGWDFSDLLEEFLKHGVFSLAEKENLINRLEKIAADSEDAKVVEFYEGLIESGESRRAVSPLLKKLEAVEKRLAAKDFPPDEDYKFIDARSKYLEQLLEAYLTSNDWRSAENLLTVKNDWNIGYLLTRIAETAARSGDYNDAVRLWKTQANLNRNSLYNLESLARYERVKIALREFYSDLQQREPDSPIPAQALKILQ